MEENGKGNTKDCKRSKRVDCLATYIYGNYSWIIIVRLKQKVLREIAEAQCEGGAVWREAAYARDGTARYASCLSSGF